FSRDWSSDVCSSDLYDICTSLAHISGKQLRDRVFVTSAGIIDQDGFVRPHRERRAQGLLRTRRASGHDIDGAAMLLANLQSSLHRVFIIRIYDILDALLLNPTIFQYDFLLRIKRLLQQHCNLHLFITLCYLMSIFSRFSVAGRKRWDNLCWSSYIPTSP